MSDNINQMNYKQIRNEVQLLRDELAIMKRKYEDIIYNLDTDNFSSRFVKEQGDMRTAIEITAEGIKTKVSKEDLNKSLSNYSTIEQTADKISTAVSSVNNSTDEKLKNYSTIEQTAQKITSTVSKEYVTNLIGDEYVTNDTLNDYKATVTSTINQKADEIYFSVEETYESLNGEIDTLRGSISSVSVTASGIRTRVEDLENFKTSVFTQKSEGFYLDGDVTKFTGVLYLTDDSFNDKASIYYGDGSDDMNQEYIAFWPNDYSMPMVFGYNPEKVYISSIADGNQIATRQWVLDNAGSSGGTATAVFG